MWEVSTILFIWNRVWKGYPTFAKHSHRTLLGYTIHYILQKWPRAERDGELLSRKEKNKRNAVLYRGIFASGITRARQTIDLNDQQGENIPQRRKLKPDLKEFSDNCFTCTLARMAFTAGATTKTKTATTTTTIGHKSNEFNERSHALFHRHYEFFRVWLFLLIHTVT